MTRAQETTTDKGDHLAIRAVGRCSVQDLGRYAGSSFGFGVGGAADQYAAQCANAAVGNDLGSPLLETTASKLAFIASTDVLMCVTGADAMLTIDGVEQPMWEPVIAHAQDLVEVSYPIRGARVYVALAATIDAPSLLGSVAPDPFVAFSSDDPRDDRSGEHADRASLWLSVGDRVALRDVRRLASHHHFGHLLVRPGVVARRPQSDPVARVIPGPDWLATGADRGWLFEHPYVVGNDSNAVGVRLAGATATAPTGGRVSRGVPIGAVEMPASDSGLIVLLRSRLLTAGYPVPAVVATVDHDIFGQLMPGDEVRFAPMAREDAVAALAARTAQVRTLLDRSRTILDSLER